jgi:hypothetical protein
MGAILTIPIRCTLRGFWDTRARVVLRAHTTALFVRKGCIMPVYSHQVIDGGGPHVVPSPW